jgi:hypothetical protein
MTQALYAHINNKRKKNLTVIYTMKKKPQEWLRRGSRKLHLSWDLEKWGEGVNKVFFARAKV